MMQTMKESIRRHFLDVYIMCDKNLSKTAKFLDISRSTAIRYKKEYITDAKKDETKLPEGMGHQGTGVLSGDPTE